MASKFKWHLVLALKFFQKQTLRMKYFFGGQPREIVNFCLITFNVAAHKTTRPLRLPQILLQIVALFSCSAENEKKKDVGFLLMSEF